MADLWWVAALLAGAAGGAVGTRIVTRRGARSPRSSSRAAIGQLAAAASALGLARDPEGIAAQAAIAARLIAATERVRVWGRAGADDAALCLLADTGADGTPVSPSPEVVRVAESRHARTARALPMVAAGTVVGVMELGARGGERPEVAAALEALAGLAAAALDAAGAHGRADDLGRTDPLTHLPNRRALAAELGAEWQRSRRYGSPLAFLMVDVDRFKRVNDRLGHPAGDEALCQVARLLAGGVRGTDTVYRYGGEEFAVLAPDTPLGAGAELGERLRRAVELRGGRRGGVGPLTVSVGVAAAELAMATPEALVALADSALYVAKRAGRNRVAALSTAEVRGVPVDVPRAPGAGPPAPGVTVLTLPGFEEERRPRPAD